LIGALNLGRGRGESFTAQEAESAQDIANQLAIAIQQSRLYEALQKELTERQKLIAQLESNNAELERFTYTVSHDLRNPLVTIKGFLGMLDKDIHDNRQDRIQSDFQRIARATDKMDALLTDLLELSRIGRFVNPPMDFDTVRLIHDALDNLDARLRSKNITMQIAPAFPDLYGDRTRLREVFENLIDNAVKYSGTQSSPLIEIGTRQVKNEAIIFIKDNGIGIEERYQTRVFALFEKLNPNIEGTGIGLALVKRIVEVHGGRVWVESEGLGKGSTFCFTIPDTRKQGN
jgi:signal transduction histidine kinase